MEWISATLAHPVWQGIAGIVAVLAIVATLVVARRPSKKVHYWIATDTQLIAEAQDVGGLEVTFDGEKVASPRLLVVEIVNGGNTPIVPEDFHKPIELELTGRGRIYTAGVVQCSPAELGPEILIEDYVLVRVAPLLLNPGDGFLLRMIVGDYKSLAVTARIAGVSTLEPPPEPKASWLSFYGMPLLVIGGLGALLGLTTDLTLDRPITPGVGVFVMFIGGLMGIVDDVIRWTRKFAFKPKRLPRKK